MIKKITKTAMLLAIVAITGIISISYSQLSNSTNRGLSQITNQDNVIAMMEIDGDFYTESKCGEGKCGEGKCGEGKSTEKKKEKKESKKEVKKSEKKSEKKTKKSSTKKETKSAKESKCGAGKCGGN